MIWDLVLDMMESFSAWALQNLPLHQDMNLATEASEFIAVGPGYLLALGGFVIDYRIFIGLLVADLTLKLIMTSIAVQSFIRRHIWGGRL
jgi:hypothetical protein